MNTAARLETTEPELSQHVAEHGRLRILLVLAPFVFIAHVLEEGPGFVEWFNAHVSRGITSQSFWQVNLAALAITVIVSMVASLDRSAASVLIAIAWLSFLMAANAVIHIASAIVDRRYVPGLITALVAYLPFFALVSWRARRYGVNAGTLIAVAGISAIPMLIHGYRIIFLGKRLF